MQMLKNAWKKGCFKTAHFIEPIFTHTRKKVLNFLLICKKNQAGERGNIFKFSASVN